MTPPLACRPDAPHIGEGEAPDDGPGPVRRCLVTGERLPKERLIRFCVGPDAMLVPDLKGVLPGRGFSCKAERGTVEAAIKKKLFNRAAARAGAAGVLSVPADLPDMIERLLLRRLGDLLGLAKRSGQLVTGFDKVEECLRHGKAALLVAAFDGARDGRSKLRALAGNLPLVEVLGVEELSLALGRENVVHAALTPGRLVKQVLDEACRLSGFRYMADGARMPGSTGLIDERR